MKPLGCLRDPSSDSDYRFADYRAGFNARIGAAPTEDLRLLQFAEIREQIGQSCVGEWVAQAQGIRDRSLGMRVRYSALACYHLSRVQALADDLGEAPPADWTYADDGSYMRAAAKAVCRWGFVYEGQLADGAWPHDRRCLLRAPSRAALDGARPTRGHVYARISGSTDERADDIARSIRAGFPVGVSISVDQKILDWTGPDAIGPARGKVLGLHALTLAGIRSDGCFAAISTWGHDWADGGIAWISSTALSRDVWVLASSDS